MARPLLIFAITMKVILVLLSISAIILPGFGIEEFSDRSRFLRSRRAARPKWVTNAHSGIEKVPLSQENAVEVVNLPTLYTFRRVRRRRLPPQGRQLQRPLRQTRQPLQKSSELSSQAKQLNIDDRTKPLRHARVPRIDDAKLVGQTRQSKVGEANYRFARKIVEGTLQNVRSGARLIGAYGNFGHVPLVNKLIDNATLIRPNIVGGFDCTGRLYGYYADQLNECQIFHICVPMKQIFPDHFGDNDVYHFSFICPEFTIFSQDAMVCAWEHSAVPCSEAHNLYYMNQNFFVVSNDDVKKETASPGGYGQTIPGGRPVAPTISYPAAQPQPVVAGTYPVASQGSTASVGKGPSVGSSYPGPQLSARSSAKSTISALPTSDSAEKASVATTTSANSAETTSTQASSAERTTTINSSAEKHSVSSENVTTQATSVEKTTSKNVTTPVSV